jgi:hypothetical protein
MMFIRLHTKEGDQQMDVRADLITFIVSEDSGSVILIDSVVEVPVNESPEEILLLMTKQIN